MMLFSLMSMKIYNTLTRQKEEFKPLDPDLVRIYSCGPTVYATPHIGNFKASFTADLLRNIFKYIAWYNVKIVMNITDVWHLTWDNEWDADHGEDRLEKWAKREGITAREVAKKYENIFMDGLSKLNIAPFDIMPRATEHIQEQIELVKSLEDKWYTYIIPWDWVYMDTSKVEDYGKLIWPNYKKHIEGLQSWVRIADVGKKNNTDFALWKFSPEDKKREMERDSPWGKWFPGWHIECSAMSSKYLGKQFDIHHGWPEHIAIHHTDEIAQSECAFWVKKWVNYRVHHWRLSINWGKMSKSLWNVYSASDFEERGYSSLDLRFFFFQAQYRSRQDFTWEILSTTKKARKNLNSKILKNLWEDYKRFKDEKTLRDIKQKCKTPKAKQFADDILSWLEDDINTPIMLATINLSLNDVNEEIIQILYRLETNIIKSWLFDEKLLNKDIVIPQEIYWLAQKRIEAKESKNYTLADDLRNQIINKWFTIKDTKDWFELWILET